MGLPGPRRRKKRNRETICSEQLTIARTPEREAGASRTTTKETQTRNCTEQLARIRDFGTIWVYIDAAFFGPLNTGAVSIAPLSHYREAGLHQELGVVMFERVLFHPGYRCGVLDRRSASSLASILLWFQAEIRSQWRT